MKNKLTIVIGGASGAVGEGILSYYAMLGHTLVAVIRNKEKQRELKKILEKNKVDTSNIHFIINKYKTEKQITTLSKTLSALGKIDFALAGLGAWYMGPQLAQLPLADWKTAISNSLSSHFYFAKAIINVFEQQGAGAYYMINGIAAEKPMPGAGSICVMNAGQKMITAVLHEELKSKNIVVQAVASFMDIKTRKSKKMKGQWISAEDVGRYIIHLHNNKALQKKTWWHKLETPADVNV